MKWWWECGATGTHTFLMGMQNWIATLENGLIVSFKVKHMFIMQIKSLIPGIYPKETKACVEKKKKPLYASMHSSLTYNCLKSETAQLSVDWCMHQQIMAHSYNGIQPVSTPKAVNYWYMQLHNVHQVHYNRCKKLDPESCALCN